MTNFEMKWKANGLYFHQGHLSDEIQSKWLIILPASSPSSCRGTRRGSVCDTFWRRRSDRGTWRSLWTSGRRTGETSRQNPCFQACSVSYRCSIQHVMKQVRQVGRWNGRTDWLVGWGQSVGWLVGRSIDRLVYRMIDRLVKSLKDFRSFNFTNKIIGMNWWTMCPMKDIIYGETIDEQDDG